MGTWRVVHEKCVLMGNTCSIFFLNHSASRTWRNQTVVGDVPAWASSVISAPPKKGRGVAPLLLRLASLDPWCTLVTCLKRRAISHLISSRGSNCNRTPRVRTVVLRGRGTF